MKILSSALIIGSAVLLAACGNQSGDVGTNNWVKQGQSVVYSYPYNSQQAVPTSAPVVLHFTSPMTVADPTPYITLYQGAGTGGSTVPFTAQVVDNGLGVVITPTQALTPLSDYTAVVSALPLQQGVAHDAQIRFRTNALEIGARSDIAEPGNFAIVRQIPDGTQFPFMDFSSLRLQFSAPLDLTTISYDTVAHGGTIAITDSTGTLVKAHVVADGHYLTVDPVTDLTPGKSYTLTLTGVKSSLGDTLPTTTIPLVPQNSQPRATMVQQVTDSNQGQILSELTGQPVNVVPFQSVLLGQNNASQQTGNVQAELAFVPHFPTVTPFHIARGTLLNGSSLQVQIGGQVPAGFDSGPVTITFLSDADGYLMPNTYNGSASAPREVRLYMDAALSTGTAQANGAITQDIVHIELVGTAIVQNDQMVINAVGVVEPQVLGIERARGVLSFYMKSYVDQTHPPAPVVDTTPPVLQSWVPGNKNLLQDASDPIVLNFSKPLDRDTLKGKISLTQNGTPIAFNWHEDGAAVVIQPAQPLQYSSDNGAFSYQVQLGSGITDMAGNALTSPTLAAFQLASQVMNRTETYDFTGGNGPESVPMGTEQRSPLVLAVYPGFPCALDSSTRDLANNLAGRCVGGFPGWNQGLAPDIKAADDVIPVVTMPANRPIIVQFSKNIDPNSVKLGSTFIVQQIQNDGTVISNVTGNLQVLPRKLVFRPDTPWQSGALYHYVLGSNGDKSSSTAVCDGTQSICDTNGLALQTDPFPFLSIQPTDSNGGTYSQYNFVETPLAPNVGGPNMEQFFRGGARTTNVLQSLAALQSSDTNANFRHEENEVITDGTAAMSFPIMNQYSYATNAQEPGAANQPADPHANQTYDPQGVTPPANSAKVISLNPTGVDNPNLIINALNVGCGFGDNMPSYPSNDGVSMTPLICPAQRFTYLTSALNAEVTGEYVPGQGVKVLIWPSAIMSTSLHLRVQVGVYPLVYITESGAQLMRMRFAPDSNGNRTQPITGWLTSGPNGPILNASVDLYMDALELSNSLPIQGLTQTLESQPITMQLSGSVQFLDDGRMLIQQANTLPININIGLGQDGGLAGTLPLQIPAYGTLLQYVSDQIK